MRVLLVAMSGVRVRDPELLELGLTLPGFVERSRVIASLPSLGLLTLAAHTPEDWEVSYREYDALPPDAASRISAEGFLVVALSALTARINETYRFAAQLRELGILVILGGLHASALPEEALRHADIVVKGEGERIWSRLLEDIRASKWRRLYASDRDEPTDFFHQPQPVPRYDLLEPERYNRLTLQTTRGCPLHCSFCAASRTISPYRKKSIFQIRRELEAIIAVWPRPFIELADDNTFVDKCWGKELAAVLGEYPLRWFTESDISIARDPALLELLAASGCAQILIGLESANEKSFQNLDSRDWKARRRTSYQESIRIIQDHGISVNGCFILGFDEDGPETFSATLDFIDSLQLAEVQITLLTPFPGTLLYEKFLSENRMLPEADWDHFTLFDLTFQPARMTCHELREGFKNLMAAVYSDDRVRERKRILRRCTKARLT